LRLVSLPNPKRYILFAFLASHNFLIRFLNGYSLAGRLRGIDLLDMS